MHRVLSFCLSIKCEVKKKQNWLKGKYGKPIFYTSIAVQRSLSPPPRFSHHATVLIRNMLTHCLTRTSPPLVFLSLYLSQHISLSLPSLDHCLPHSPSSSFPPPSPSFWRVGSSEVVAVCIAKGNVSSTHRKMGQNIRTLPAHAQWHTVLGLYTRSESEYCVLSYPLPQMNVPTSHSCLFSSIIDGTQQLMARFTIAAISVEQCSGLDIEKIEEERTSFVNNGVMFTKCPPPKKSGCCSWIYVPLCLSAFQISSIFLLYFLSFLSSRHPSPKSFP